MSSEQTATVVVAACIEQDGKFLVRNRLEDNEPSIQYMWEFLGGRMRLGETLLRTLWREVKEELGHVVKDSPPARLVHAQINRYDSGTDYLVMYYHCQVYGHIEYYDHTKFLFLTPAEIVRDEAYPGFLPGTIEAASRLKKATDVQRDFSFAEHDVGLQSPEQILLIMTYELGKVIEYRHKASRYGETGYYSDENQQKEMSDLISMVRYYCEQRGWGLDALMELGEKAYLDRMEDLRKHGKEAKDSAEVTK